MGQWKINKKTKQIKSDNFEINLVNDSMQMKKFTSKLIMNYTAFIID